MRYQEMYKAFLDFGCSKDEFAFENNSISPGTKFMYELNK